MPGAGTARWKSLIFWDVTRDPPYHPNRPVCSNASKYPGVYSSYLTHVVVPPFHIKPILRASKGFRRVLKVFPKFDLRIRNLSLPFLAFGRSKGVFGANLALSVGGTSLDSPALGGGSA